MKTSVKRIIIFLAVLLLTAAFSVIASAKTYSGTDGGISWSVDLNTSQMTISGDGEMTDYGNFSLVPYSAYLPFVKTLTVESGVTSLGDCSFMYAYSLESVSLPSSLESIGSSAFEYCIKLKEINIPHNTYSIGSMAFSSCRALESLVLPSSLMQIGEYAFCDCSALQTINIPIGITELCNGTFTGCTSLSNVTGLDSLQYIGNGAFYNCTSLKLNEFPKNVTELSPRAFFGCSSLNSLIPSNVLSPDGAFYNSSARFNVNWLIDGNVTKTEVKASDIPSYNGTPKKDCVLDGIYSFASWDKAFTPAVTPQNEYKAVFSMAKPIVSASYSVNDGYVNVDCVLDLGNVTAKNIYILFSCHDESGTMICSQRSAVKSSDTTACASLFLRGRQASTVKAYVYTDFDFLTPLGQCVTATML